MIPTYNEEQFKKLKNISLSSLEKTEIRDSLKHFMVSHPINSHPTLWDKIKKQHTIISPYNSLSIGFGKSLAFSLIALITMGGSITFASTNAIPGEFLYPVKINIKESIEETFAKTPEEKLAAKEKKVTRRLAEVQILRHKKDLTKKEAVIAQTILKEHVKELTDTLTDLKQQGREDVVLASTAELLPKTEILMKNNETKNQVEEPQKTSVQIPPKIEEIKTEKPILLEKTIPPLTELEENTDLLFELESTNSDVIKDTLGKEVKKQVEQIKKTVEKAAADKIPEEISKESLKKEIKQKKIELELINKKIK